MEIMLAPIRVKLIVGTLQCGQLGSHPHGWAWLDNIISIVTDDAVLLANADKMQDVRTVVEKLQNAGVSQGSVNERDYRPWGWFEVLLNAPNYKVKRLHVHPKASLSLQSHKHRSEHWVVVEGIATVVCEERCFELPTNESVYIEAGQKHRLANNWRRASDCNRGSNWKLSR